LAGREGEKKVFGGGGCQYTAGGKEGKGVWPRPGKEMFCRGKVPPDSQRKKKKPKLRAKKKKAAWRKEGGGVQNGGKVQRGKARFPNEKAQRKRNRAERGFAYRGGEKSGSGARSKGGSPFHHRKKKEKRARCVTREKGQDLAGDEGALKGAR